MNLKEAFRFQNKLQTLIDEAQLILAEETNVTCVTNTYLRKKISSELEDETVHAVPNTEYYDRITDVTRFLLWLITEKTKLSSAIRTTKNTLEFDLDGEIGLNAVRQSSAKILQRMNDYRSSEKLIPNGGKGYRFNTDGNQTMFLCDVKRITTINFDRNVIRREMEKLNKLSDDVSAKIDLCLVTAVVDYTRPFDVNVSFSTAFDIFSGETID